MEKLQSVQQFFAKEIQNVLDNHSAMGKDIEDLKVNYQTTSQQLQALQNEVAKLSIAHEKIPYLFMLPDRTEWFSGRDSELENLHTLLQINDDINEPKVQIASVCGLGGSGKTSLAAEYAHRWKDYYEGGVFWFSGEDETRFANSVDDHAVYLGTLVEASAGKTLLKTLEEISKIQKPWLLVLDDMDEFKLCSNIGMLLSGPWKRRVKGSGHILITTRREPKVMRETIRGLKESQCIQLECFNLEDGKLFVFRRTGIYSDEETSAEAANLVETLGGLPLALEQACAYISHLSCSMSEYLQQYEKYTLELLDEQDASSASMYGSRERLAVRTTWLLNFEYIKQSKNGNFAVRFLHACAFFNPTEIQQDLINPGKPPIEDNAYQEYVDTALGSSHILKLLTDFSLFKKNKRSSLSVHRLVQEVIRGNISPENYVSSLVDAIRLLSYAFSFSRSPDDLLTSMINKHHDRATLQTTDPSLFHKWHKMCLHAHEVRKLLLDFLKSSQLLDQRIVIPETARLVYECALHLNVNSKTAEAKAAVDFAYKIIRFGDTFLTKDDLATLFPHEIPLPELVRRVISYSCVAPRDTKSLSYVVEEEDIMPFSDLKEQENACNEKRVEGNTYFQEGHFEKAVEVYTSVINMTKGTSSFDPTFLSNRASAFIRLHNFGDGLRDAEDYISHRPKCCKGYAKKAQALHGLKRFWDATCAAALAYYYNKDIFSSFAPFKHLFHSLKDRIYICRSSTSLLVSSILHCNFRSQKESELPRKIIIFEPGDYTFQRQMYICDTILIGVEDSGTKRIPLLSFQGSVGMFSSRCIMAVNISFVFDTGCWETNDDTDATFVNCSFTSNAGQGQQAFLSSGATTFTNCHFDNCKGNALRVLGKAFVEKCIFSANGDCGVQVFSNGELEMKNSKLHGNKLGIHMGPDAGRCCVIDCDIYDNRYQGVVTFCSLNIILTGNRIYQNDRHGINLEGESFTHIEGNEIFENCWQGIATMDNARCNVINNKVYRNKHGGIQVVPIGPVPEDCHSVVENNEIFDNGGPGIYDEMVFRDQPNIPREQTLREHIYFDKHRKQMWKAKFKGNKERNNNKTDHAHSENEAEPLDFCAFCGEKKPLQNCTGCYSVGYCRKSCQKSDWKKHKSVCASLLQESSVVVNVVRKESYLGRPSKDHIIIAFNEQAPGLDPKGPEYANPPKYGKRFIVKVQAGDSVRQSNLGSSLLVVYDRSMTVHGDLDWKHCPLYHTVQRCGKIAHGIGWTKMFFWAMFCNPDDYNTLRIFTKILPPYQNW
jgi:parallel beta-helix repeat protein